MALWDRADRKSVELSECATIFRRENVPRTSVSQLALTTAIGLLGLPALSTTTWAQCVLAGGSNFVCAGANTATQTVNAPNAAVTTTPGFSVDTTTGGGGRALDIENNGAISYVDTAGSSLTGSSGLAVKSMDDAGGVPGSVTIVTNGNVTATTGNGIYTENHGTGATHVTVTGQVRSSGNSGIFADNSSTATDLTIMAASVTGGNGITGSNFGTGATFVKATGHVEGNGFGGEGIAGINQTTATDLTVEATSATGQWNGIRALNRGTGATRVTATGHAEAIQYDGIFAENAASATGLTVEAASASGGKNGIVALNGGGGATRVTATGAATGGQAYGILATNGDPTFHPDGSVNTVGPSTATDLIVNATSVTGGIGGIYAHNNGTGATNVIATGHVSGADDDGIAVFSSGAGTTVNAASVSGDRYGILVTSSGTGVTQVTASGLVTGGTLSGIEASAIANAATDLSVDAVAVSGGFSGIAAANSGSGNTRVTATGTVTGGTGFGISAAGQGADVLVEAKDVVGGTRGGISAYNSGIGAARVIATGTVTGDNFGIFAGVSLQTGTNVSIDAVDVTGGIGITASNNGTGSTRVTATGAVIGTADDGIRVEAHTLTTGGVEINAARVTGDRNGISAINRGGGATKVAATGPVSGGESYGILAVNGAAFINPDGSISPVGVSTATSLTVEAARVTGVNAGIYAQNNGTGATRVIATGAVAAGPSGTGIFAANGTSTTGAGTTLRVEALNGASGFTGISTRNYGSGATDIVATGLVEGIGGHGIVAVNGATAKSLFVNVENVSGSVAGILASNDGTGATDVIADDVQSSAGTAVMAGGRGSRVNVDVASAVGEVSGIVVVNNGSGATRVISGRSVGQNGHGINATNAASATDVTIISAGIATGDVGGNGIRVRNNGTGTTLISTGALVEGGAAAISAFSAGQAITIEAGGLVRNLSRLSTSVAIEGGGGPIDFTNAGGMVGTVQFGAGAHIMTNKAAWNTAGGTNEFGGGELSNVAGVAIFAAADGGVAETTAFNGLANFNNHGMFIMADGGAGDRAATGGNVRFEADSVYAIDINGTGQSDRITANGAATLVAGSTLAVSMQGSLLYGNRYTVLTADGGVNGQFGSVTGLPANTAFLAMLDTYDANNAYLDVVKYRNFADAGLTRNQISTGRGLDSIPTVGPLFNAVAGLMTDTQARSAFDQLSGEQHASMSSVLVDDNRFVRSSAIDRLRSAFGSVGVTSVPVMSYAPGGPTMVPATTERFALWGQAFGSWGRLNGDGNAAAVRRSTGGFTIGGDTLIFDSWRVGLLGGYSNTSFSISGRSSSGSSDNYHVSVYGGRQFGNLSLRTGAAYTWHDIKTNRSVAFPGFNDALSASYGARTAQVFGDLGYRIDMNSVSLEPFGSLAYVNLRTEGFRETGGPAALTSKGTTTGVTFTTLGLRASTDFAFGGMIATARGTLGWRHAFGNTAPVSTFAFAGGNAFNIAGVPIAQNAAVVEAGLDLRLFQDATFGVSYNGQFASSARDQSVKANLAVKF